MEDAMRSSPMLALSGQMLLGLAIAGPGYAAEPALQPLKLAKECSQYSGGIPSFCTITESSLGALPSGTRVLYYGPVTSNPNFSSNDVVLDDGAGNTAAGNCIVDFAGEPAGICAFYAGNGTLAGFQAVVKVSVDEAGLWHWEGSYGLAAETQ
jgi:hypothetical protein